MTQTTLSTQFTHTYAKGLCPKGYRSEVEYGTPLLTGITGPHDDATSSFVLGADHLVILHPQKVIHDSLNVNPTDL